VQKPKIIVEIGTGGSSFCVLKAIKETGIGHLHTIDCWPYSPPCTDQSGATHRFHEDGTPFALEHSYFLDKAKQEEYEEFFTLHYQRGEEAAREWNQPINMIVLDAGHHEKETVEEWEGLAKHLVPGGYALLHDPIGCLHEVGSFLEEYCKKNDDFSFIIEPNLLGMAIVQRKFTVSPYNFLFSSRLVSTLDNSQSSDTPLILTNARNIGILKKWRGFYFPPIKEFRDAEKIVYPIADELIASGEEQSLDQVEFLENRLKELGINNE
jgi:hypothetical protein